MSARVQVVGRFCFVFEFFLSYFLLVETRRRQAATSMRAPSHSLVDGEVGARVELTLVLELELDGAGEGVTAVEEADAGAVVEVRADDGEDEDGGGVATCDATSCVGAALTGGGVDVEREDAGTDEEGATEAEEDGEVEEVEEDEEEKEDTRCARSGGGGG